MTAKYYLERIYYTFPVQLAVLLVKKSHTHLIYWLLLFGFITESLGDKFGLPYLFLDPEYLNHVGFLSFFIVGIALGGFIMAFNISSYILHGRDFSFLATLSRPFLKYILNNCIIPGLFIATYLYKIYTFQESNEYKSVSNVLIQMLGLMTGILSISFITITYFFSTNKDIFKFVDFGIVETAGKRSRKKKTPTIQHVGIRVDTYLSSSMAFRIARSASHYPEELSHKVFTQNHRNAAIIEFVTFAIIIIIGTFRAYEVFQIPAAASVLILFSMVMMFLSALRYWFKGWANILFLALFLLFNYLSQFYIINTPNRAYGIDYKGTSAVYTPETIAQNATPNLINQDSVVTIQILEAWKQRASLVQHTDKPKLLIIGASGGGMRASLWSVRCMQYADSLLGGQLLTNTQMMTGASGGIIGSAYYRELVLQNSIGDTLNRYGKSYYNSLGKDLLNPIVVSLCVSDMFVNLQKFYEGRNNYAKDRAYAFESQLNKNTHYLLNKRLCDYTSIERKAQVPMLIMAPSILNDGRRLLISSQPISYLCNKNVHLHSSNTFLHENVEFSRMFKEQDAERLYYTTALRMNSTFPYIMPNVSLPAEPNLEVMDAGLRDNFGVKISLRYLLFFKQWIQENTSGIVYLQIRDTPREISVKAMEKNSMIKTLSDPVSSYYGNWEKIQDYTHDEYICLSDAWLGEHFKVINLELPVEKEKIALSWHLTTREKKFIYHATNHPLNQEGFKNLKEALLPDSLSINH